VDAIFGAGLSGALEGAAADTLAAAALRGTPIVAVAVPSGLMGDTGEVLGAVAAVLTVTFFRKKPGHLLLPGRLLCGEVVVADIGNPPSVLEQIVPDTLENDPGLWLADLPRPHDGGNKYTRGHALIPGGLSHNWRCPDGGPRGCWTDDDRGTRNRSVNLRCGTDRHHGPPPRGAGRFCQLAW